MGAAGSAADPARARTRARRLVISAVLGAALGAGVAALPWAAGPRAATGGDGSIDDGGRSGAWLGRAERGEPTAQYAVGVISLYVHHDFAKARYWLRPAADGGDARAQYELGKMILLGLGVAQSDATALRWFRRAAAQRLPIAEHALGAACYFGLAGAPDRAAAARWFRRAAQAGIPMARVNLGIMYQRGAGVARDHGEAAKWYRLAAEQSVGSALRSTGLFVDARNALPKAGMAMYRLEAEHALTVAKRRLGILYAHGWGVRKSPVRAYMWLVLAAASGDGAAAALRMALARSMTAEQLAEARILAHAWAPKD